MAWPAVKRAFEQEPFGRYVDALRFGAWRPSLIVLHNTAAPTLAQWHATADQDRARGFTPGQTRINNLEDYYRNRRGWSGCPHLFVADDYIWVANPLTAPGVHSPSWNHISIGIETVGNYDVEDDDAGPGLKVKNNAIFAMAVLCRAYGLDIHQCMRLHKEDPRTTHKCPGDDMAQDKQKIMDSVAALMDGGEHSESDVADAIEGRKPEPTPEQRGVVTVNHLNFRRGPGISFSSTGELNSGDEVAILQEAANDSTGWYRVRTRGDYVGWVAGRFVKKM